MFISGHVKGDLAPENVTVIGIVKREVATDLEVEKGNIVREVENVTVEESMKTDTEKAAVIVVTVRETEKGNVNIEVVVIRYMDRIS